MQYFVEKVKYRILEKQTMRHHEENVFFFFVKILFIFQPLLRQDNTIKRYGPLMNYQPANYGLLKLYTLFNNRLGQCRSCACRSVWHMCSTLPQIRPGLLGVCIISILKTLWEKEILLISNFSFSHSAFYPKGEIFAIFIKL